MKEIYYTISKNNDKWVVWKNIDNIHSYGSTSIFKGNSRKDCIKYCKDNNIPITRNEKNINK